MNSLPFVYSTTLVLLLCLYQAYGQSNGTHCSCSLSQFADCPIAAPTEPGTCYTAPCSGLVCDESSEMMCKLESMSFYVATGTPVDGTVTCEKSTQMVPVPVWDAPAPSFLSCESLIGPAADKSLFLLFVADDGTFSGTAEYRFYADNMENVVEFNTPTCGYTARGLLLKQEVILVATGIGPMTANGCVQTMLQTCGPKIRESAYTGTSGWSPQVGGVLNPSDCSAANSPETNPVIQVGDLCITTHSANWDCKKAFYPERCVDYPNLCVELQWEFPPQSNFLFGECFYPTSPEQASDLSLYNELLAAAHSPEAYENYQRIPAITQYEERYWGAMGNGTGYTYGPFRDKPIIFNNSQCAEIDSQYFANGAPYEEEMRRFVAFVNEKFGITQGPGDTVAVAAMEAIGFIKAFVEYNAEVAPDQKIPFVNMRGKSNNLMGTVKEQTPGSGIWVDGPNIPEDFENGYAQAIQSTSVAMLQMMKFRCLKNFPSDQCTYDATPARR